MKEQADRLKQVRKTLGLTQKEFASKLNQQDFKIRDIEVGRLRFTTELAVLIEKTFKIDSKWLLTGIGNMFLPEQEERLEQRLDIGYVSAKFSLAYQGLNEREKEFFLDLANTVFNRIIEQKNRENNSK